MNAMLLVANYDSDVGYAWWLMESFWVKLAETYHSRNRIILAYPSISKLPESIADAPLQTVEQDFGNAGFFRIIHQGRILRRWGVRTIYFSDHPTWHWSYALFRICGVKTIIVHDHTPGVRTPPKGIKRLLKSFAHRLPWFTADGAIGATDYVKRRLIEVNMMPEERCHSAPNGLPSLAKVTDKADLHLLFKIPENRKILVMTGRAHRYKGVEFILLCLSNMNSESRENLHFLFVGDGPALGHFKGMARKFGILGHCTFAGRRSDIVALLKGADFAMHPSKGEVGYSLSILEYMRAGLPVIVPDNPSVCGATQHKVTGLIYPEGDVNKAIGEIEKALKFEDLRHEMNRNARVAVLQFPIKSTHAALCDAIDEIVGLGLKDMYKSQFFNKFMKFKQQFSIF